MNENRRRNNPDDMNFTELLYSIKEAVCDDICRYTNQKKHGKITQEMLNEICEHDCPLRKL